MLALHLFFSSIYLHVASLEKGAESMRTVETPTPPHPTIISSTRRPISAVDN